MPIAADHPPPVWHAPVEPVAIVRRYREVAPFAAGGHRGIDLRAEPGVSVAAPCSGRVTFRGAVAGGPPTVTIDCGRLRATLQRVAPAVVAGARVGRGSRVGVATSAAVDLSARRPDGTYLDPAQLLGQFGQPAPVVTVPRARSRRPGLTSSRAQRPARVADRALVNTKGVVPAQSLAGRPGRADRPLGFAGLGLAALVAGLWAVAAVRRLERRARRVRLRAAARPAGR